MISKQKQTTSRKKGALIFALVVVCAGVIASYVFPWQAFITGAEKWRLGPAVLISEREPVWSPDSRSIAFLCFYSYASDWLDPGLRDMLRYHQTSYAGDVCVYHRIENRLERITFDRSKRGAAWTRDGNLLILDWEDYQPVVGSFSPDGRYEAYERTGPDDYGGPDPDEWYTTVDVIENGKLVLRSPRSLHGYYYGWSPADSILAMWGNERSTGKHSSQMVFTYIPTLETTSINIDPDLYSSFEWQKSDRIVAIGKAGNVEIVSLTCTTTPFSCTVLNRRSFILSHFGDGDHPFGRIFLSPDKNFLVYTDRAMSEQSRIWIVDLETGEETLMLKDR